MTLRSIEGGGQNRRTELFALVDDGVDPIVEALREAIDHGEFAFVVQHAEDLRAAADAIRELARGSD